MQKKFVSPSGIIVSTVKIHYGEGYETMIFNSKGKEIFCRRYTNIQDASKWHEYYIKQNSK